MNHEFRFEITAGGVNRPTSWQTTVSSYDYTAFLNDSTTTSRMDGTINATTTHQVRVGSIDNRIGGLLGDIALNKDNSSLPYVNFWSLRRSLTNLHHNPLILEL